MGARRHVPDGLQRLLSGGALTLAIVRMGLKRFLGKGTAFDIIPCIMLGSVMSRAINGAAPFFPILLAGAALAAIH